MKKFSTGYGQFAGLLLAGASLLGACEPKKEDPKPPVTPPVVVPPVTPPPVTPPPVAVNVIDSVYVVNEGTSNGAVSLFNKLTGNVQRDVYAPANGGQRLGPFVQSLTVAGRRAYLVVNGSDAVQVVSYPGFVRQTTIAGRSQPRYLLAASATKAYLTEWQGGSPNYQAGRVAVINLTTNVVTSTIPVGINPEEMLLADGRLYVTSAEGSALTVINTATDAVESTIAVPPGSKNIARDANGNIWLLCSKYLETTDFLVKFAPATPTQQTRIAFPNDYRNGNLRLNAAGTRIYVSLGTGTYALDPAATALPAAPLVRRNFYGLGIDPQDGTIYGGTVNFSGDARTIRYTPAGAVIDSFNVAIGPNSFRFQ